MLSNFVSNFPVMISILFENNNVSLSYYTYSSQIFLSKDSLFGNGLKHFYSMLNVLELQITPAIFPIIQPFPKRKILDSSKLKEYADDNLNFDENGKKFSKRVENTVGKGKIARYEQFLLFPPCF